MRRLVSLLILVPHLAVSAAGSPAPESGDRRDRGALTTLSILPFASSSEGKEGEKKIGDRMTEELQVLLSESGRFRILTRSEMTLEKMNKLIELQAQQGKAEERAPFQRLTCEEAFIAGTIHKSEDRGYTVYLDVISLATGEKLVALRMRCWHENAFRRLARAFTREIVSRVDMTGAIVKNQGDTFFVQIDRGPEGVRAGDLLEVRHPSQPIKDAEREIDPGEEPVCGTLVVEAITATGHLRCSRKPGEKGKADMAEGDKVRVVPVVPSEKRRPQVALRLFTVGAAEAAAKTAQEEFATLVREELLVSAADLHGLKIVNPAGLNAVAAPETDDRVVCDALGVDAVLSARLSVRAKKARFFLNLLPYAQRDVYEREPAPAEAGIARAVSVDLEEDDKLTPEAAAKAAESIVEAFRL
ncbi:MAG TPA: hypothetical protein DCM87_12440 [Planctomycetes bacterium]|nr:hypothetical protein [Planctomycetota bacterium]